MEKRLEWRPMSRRQTHAGWMRIFKMSILNKHSTSMLLLVILPLLFSQPVEAAADFVRANDHNSLQLQPPEFRINRDVRGSQSLQGRSSNKKANKKNYIENITRQTGTTAILNCRIKDFLNVTTNPVIWVKKEANDKIIILTINNKTHTIDKRFAASNDTDPKNWRLHIRYTETSDQGVYECQVCTHPTSSVYVNLTLIEAHAAIFGGSKKEVKAGSPLRLSCVLRRSIQAPSYIFWYHWDEMINYNLGDGASVRHGRQGSELIFPRAEPRHAGNYSCVPSNARQASVVVDVRYSEKAAAAAIPQKAVGASGASTYRLNLGDSVQALFLLGLMLPIFNFHIYR